MNLPGAVLIKSANLQDDVWVVDGWPEYAEIRKSRDQRSIYLRSELPHLKGMTPEEQLFIHLFKKIMVGEIIETLPWNETMSKKIDIGDEKQDNCQHGQRTHKVAAKRRYGGDPGGTDSFWPEH